MKKKLQQIKSPHRHGPTVPRTLKLRVIISQGKVTTRSISHDAFLRYQDLWGECANCTDKRRELNPPFEDFQDSDASMQTDAPACTSRELLGSV